MNKFLQFNVVKGVLPPVRARDIVPCRNLSIKDRKRLAQGGSHIVGTLPRIGAAYDHHAYPFRLSNRRLGTPFEAGAVIPLEPVDHCLQRSRKKVIIHRSKERNIVRVFKVLKKNIQIFVGAARMLLTKAAVGTGRRRQLLRIIFYDLAVDKIRLHLADQFFADSIWPRRTADNQ